MKYTEKKPAVLVLEDGTIFQGKAAGAIGTTSGEICFNTGMTVTRRYLPILLIMAKSWLLRMYTLGIMEFMQLKLKVRILKLPVWFADHSMFSIQEKTLSRQLKNILKSSIR